MSMIDEPERERPEGAIEAGMWCNHCMLPSACKWEATIAVAGGREAGKINVVVCVDCGNRLDSNGDPIR